MFCKNCGTQLADGAQFCTACGTMQFTPNEAVQEPAPIVPEVTPAEPVVEIAPAAPVAPVATLTPAPKKTEKGLMDRHWNYRGHCFGCCRYSAGSPVMEFQ